MPWRQHRVFTSGGKGCTGLSWGDLVLPQSVTFSYCCTCCPRLEVCCSALEQGWKKSLDPGILLTSGGPFPYPMPGARICFLISFTGESSAVQGQTKVLFSNWHYGAPWVQPDSLVKKHKCFWCWEESVPPVALWSPWATGSHLPPWQFGPFCRWFNWALGHIQSWMTPSVGRQSTCPGNSSEMGTLKK